MTDTDQQTPREYDGIPAEELPLIFGVIEDLIERAREVARDAEAANARLAELIARTQGLVERAQDLRDELDD